MDLSLSEVAAGWPLAASLAVLLAGSAHGGRRRSALNECLHELRRPLQVLALTGASPAGAEGAESCLRLASQALERLDREINGRPALSRPGPVGVEPLLRVALSRWQSRTELRGGSVRLCWRAGTVAVRGDRARLEQALDNLLANALDHGGPQVQVEARREEGAVAIAVVDSGVPSPGRPGGRNGKRALARLSGRRRHGHGLRLVRRVAAEHGGEFELRRGTARTEAVLCLPVLGAGAER
jgi:signal transduction histidine kinase